MYVFEVERVGTNLVCRLVFLRHKDALTYAEDLADVSSLGHPLPIFDPFTSNTWEPLGLMPGPYVRIGSIRVHKKYTSALDGKGIR